MKFFSLFKSSKSSKKTLDQNTVEEFSYLPLEEQDGWILFPGTNLPSIVQEEDEQIILPVTKVPSILQEDDWILLPDAKFPSILKKIESIEANGIQFIGLIFEEN